MRRVDRLFFRGHIVESLASAAALFVGDSGVMLWWGSKGLLKSSHAKQHGHGVLAATASCGAFAGLVFPVGLPSELSHSLYLVQVWHVPHAYGFGSAYCKWCLTVGDRQAHM